MRTTQSTSRKANVYAGTCSKCGAHVAAQAGLLGSKVNGRWTVRHTDCAANTQVAPARQSLHAHRYATRRPACITGGNCSSFGTGRDCGGYDCDGY